MPKRSEGKSFIFTVGIYQEYGSLDMDGLPQEQFNPEDIKLPSNKKDAAYVLQVATNTFARNAAGNAKALFDLSPQNGNYKDFLESKGGFLKYSFLGVSSRFTYSALGLLPSLKISGLMSDAGFSKPLAISASTGWETLVGSALEAKGLSRSRPEMLNLAAGFQGCIFPFAIRNSLGWIAINGVEKSNPFSAFSAGFFAGTISALPDTVGAKAMYQLSCNSQSKICSVKEIIQALEKGFIEAIKNPKALGIAASIRGLAGGFSTLILSKQLTEKITEGLNYFFGKSPKEELEALPQESISSQNSTAVEKPLAINLKANENDLENSNSSSRC
jgi:hypothetical protein